jgi:hypothetical protein
MWIHSWGMKNNDEVSGSKDTLLNYGNFLELNVLNEIINFVIMLLYHLPRNINFNSLYVFSIGLIRKKIDIPVHKFNIFLWKDVIGYGRIGDWWIQHVRVSV